MSGRGQKVYPAKHEERPRGTKDQSILCEPSFLKYSAYLHLSHSQPLYDMFVFAMGKALFYCNQLTFSNSHSHMFSFVMK